MEQGMLGSHLRLLDQTIPEEERYQSLELDSEDEKDALKADDIAAEDVDDPNLAAEEREGWGG